MIAKKKKIQVESHSKLQKQQQQTIGGPQQLQYVSTILLYGELDTPPQVSHVSILSNNMCPKAKEKIKNGLPQNSLVLQHCPQECSRVFQYNQNISRQRCGAYMYFSPGVHERAEVRQSPYHSRKANWLSGPGSVTDLIGSVADPGCLSHIPDPDFCPSIPDPWSKNSNKRERWKNFWPTFFLKPQISQIENYFIFELAKKKIWANLQGIIEIFTRKIVIKLSKLKVWDPRSGKNLFRIPDPGSKRHRIPDPQHC